ncbi:MAG: AgmX/PglI C-terminal domain-containing protein [Deltaproteobacteria bacterium]|nr:AgmX/PglI C-terminal domain-containing protein [Deltaproteobacteria bacterium]
MRNISVRSSIAALLAVGLVGCPEPPPPAPTVASAELLRGSAVVSREGHDETEDDSFRIEQGSTLRASEDGRLLVRHDSGSRLLLDRASAANFTLELVRFEAGRIWVEGAEGGGERYEVRGTTLNAEGATFAVELSDDGAKVHCLTGELGYQGESGEGQVAQGETLSLGGQQADVAPTEVWDDFTGGLSDPAPAFIGAPGYVGVLSGRTPLELGRARAPLSLRAHRVNVTLRGDLAVTEVVQTFFNARSDLLEADYRVRLPRGAIVESFGIDQGQGFIDGVVNTMQTDSAYGLSWAEVGMPMGRLSYDGPDRVRARIFPVQAGGTVRVRLRYTEWLDRRGDRRTYVYPMHTEGQAPLIGELLLTVDLGDGQVGALRAGMGARIDGGLVNLRRSDFRPRSDFVLDVFDGEDVERPDGAIAYEVDAPRVDEDVTGDESYVLFDIPTEGLELEQEDRQPATPAIVILLDVSGATEPEDLELARGTLEAVLRQLSPTDRVTIRLADLTAHLPEGAPEEPTAASDEVRRAILDSIARVHLGGATDLGRSLRDAAAVLQGEARGAVLYIGDGVPTTGALDVTQIARGLASLEDPPRFFAFAMGDDANLDLLQRLFGEGAVRVTDRRDVVNAVLALSSELTRPTLRGVRVDLGPGVERVYPAGAVTLPRGAHLRVVGRLADDMPQSITLRGRYRGQTFRQELNVTPKEVQDDGDVRRRWASNRVLELVDADAGREALAELGMRFGILTPWTSLVVGASRGQTYQPLRGFDPDPFTTRRGLSGGGALLDSQSLGWRARRPSAAAEIATAPESTWVDHVARARIASAGTSAGQDSRRGDGGLGRVVVQRALAGGMRGPQACYDRALSARPDLGGVVRLRLKVSGTGELKESSLLSSTLGATDVTTCILAEVRGIRFPSTGSSETVEVIHTYRFAMPTRILGARRRCSDASRQALASRRDLWRERLAANGGVPGAISVWREALQGCELGSWHSKKALLDMMLRHVGGVRSQLQLYRAFVARGGAKGYLRRAILRHVRTPQDVAAVRAMLGLDANVDWSYFGRLYRAASTPAARLRLVNRWLSAMPEDISLRLRKLALLEETNAMPQARRVARELSSDPLADAKVRTAVGEFWLRQDDTGEARRVFSEIVEFAPLDPWARRRLGDVYRANGWADDATREYQALARLRPDDSDVLLLLARSAADAGRTDEALRLEARLAETDSPDVMAGSSAVARLWSLIRLARMKLAAEGDAAKLAEIARRERSTGVLRDLPAVFIALTWKHPDDAPELYVHLPSTPEDTPFERAPLRADAFGVEAARVRDWNDEALKISIRRSERDALRDLDAELLIVVAPGTPEEQIVRRDLSLTRSARRFDFQLATDGTLSTAPIPRARANTSP